jgi:hypothetical protein
MITDDFNILKIAANSFKLSNIKVFNLKCLFADKNLTLALRIY